MNSDNIIATRRRGLLTLGSAALFAAIVTDGEARAAPTGDASPFAPVQELDNALLTTMRQGQSVAFTERYRALDPVVERVFNLDEILQRSVGLGWPSMPPAQKVALAAAFRRYTVSSYLANFNSYNGQNFQVLADTRPVGNGQVVVQTKLLRVNNSPIALDYVVSRGSAGWQVVDVLTNGTISRVAVQRSDFRELLSSGGVPALTASLEHKVASLSGGMAA